jgi:hypothetical protein
MHISTAPHVRGSQINTDFFTSTVRRAFPIFVIVVSLAFRIIIILLVMAQVLSAHRADRRTVGTVIECCIPAATLVGHTMAF